MSPYDELDQDLAHRRLNRRQWLQRSLTLAATALAAPCLRGQSRPARPNFLLISIDTLRADHMSLYGYPRRTTPNLERMAAEGVWFRNAYSVTSWTGSSHASLFTGVYPPVHQLDHQEMRLAQGWPTLAGLLRDHGYQTQALISGPMVETRMGFGQGFDHFDESTYKTAIDFAALRQQVNYPGITDKQAHEEILLYKTQTGETVRQAAEQFLETPPPAPWFLFLHLWDVHGDYTPPPQYDIFDPGYSGSIDGNIKSQKVHADMDPRDLQRFVSLYDAEILWTDHQLGLLMEALRRSPAAQDTCVILFSDHGEEFFEYGNKGHGHNLHDILIHVPLIFWWPGRAGRGVVVDQPVSMVDVAPTLLSMASREVPRHFQGRDLSAALEGRVNQLTAVPQFGSLFFRGRTEIYSIRYPLKLIQNATSGELYLYNLMLDPAERNNLSPQFLPTAQRMNDDLRRWWEACQAIQPILPGSVPLET